jgi:Ser-tRNA(Ala) deacylase AlaX
VGEKMFIAVEKETKEPVPFSTETEDAEYIDLSLYSFQDKSIPYLLGEKISRKFEMLALEKNDNELVLAMKDPKNIFAIDSAALITSLDIKPVLVDPEKLLQKMDEVFYKQKQEETVVSKAVPEKEEKEKKSGSPTVFKEKLGNILISQNIIDENQLENALEIQKKNKDMPLGSIMVQEGFINKEQLFSALEEQTGIKYFDLTDVEIAEDIIRLVDRKLAHSYTLIPVKVKTGMIQVGDIVNIKIDIAKRKSTERNHTTTHILHKALKNVIGDHVNQSGSLVTADRLRFDFTHFTALSAEQIDEIERQVNDVILSNYPVHTEEMSLEEAKQEGATALFGEKYEDTVRVVSVDGYSKELCGGTHISATGEAGLIKIVSESSIASGIRRIEALTGTGAIEWYREREKLLNEASMAAKTTPEETASKIAEITDELKKTRRELEEIKAKALKNSVNDLIQKASDVSGVKVLAERMDGLDINGLRNTADMARSKLGSSVVILASGMDGKVSLIISATKDVVEKGIHCGKIIGEAAKAAGGGGGGRPDMAQAGGRDINGIDKAIEIALKKVKEILS